MSAGRIELAGTHFDAVTEAEVIDRIVTSSGEGRGGSMIAVNTDVLRQTSGDAELRRLVARGTFVVADGMPLVWASRAKGQPLPERVAGSTMVWTLSEAAARAGRSIFLLGGNPGVAEHAATVLRKRYPDLRVAGCHCPPFGFERDPGELARIEHALSAAQPDIVFCALGFPKQERLMARLSERFEHTWFIACGYGLSFVAGDGRRAPRWMQRVGLEWLHRLATDPRRLFRRYVLHDIPFAMRMLWKAARSGPR